MNDALPPGMLEATRLLREGRFVDSAAMLRRALHGSTAPGGAAPDVPRDTDMPGDAGMRSGLGTGVPRVLRGLFDRIKQAGLLPGMGGAADPVPAPPADEGKEAEGPNVARFVTATYANAAGSRTYKLYIPGGYHGQSVPLVVMLHGCTQSPDDFAAGTRMNVLAEEQTFLVAYPAQSAAANAQRCWNWFKPADQQRDRGEPSLVAGITGDIMRNYAVDARRCYVAGLSAGGAAASIMGNAYPDLYAAIGVHSGLACGAASDVSSAFFAMRQGRATARSRAGGASGSDDGFRIVPTIVFHGDRDTTVNPRNGDQVIAQLRERMGTDLPTSVSHDRVPGGRAYTRTRHVDFDGNALLEQWVVHGEGHAWSGGDPAGSYTDPPGPDAAREMLRFFLEHECPAPAGQG